MFCYKRKTAFIEYYINGIKSRTIGVVKQKLEDDSLWLMAEVSGPKEWRNVSCKVSVGDVEGQFPLFDIPLSLGKGNIITEIPLKKVRGYNCRKLFFSFENNCYGLADLLEIPDVLYEEEQNDAEEEKLTDVPKQEEELPEEELLADCLEPQPDKWEVIKKKYPILYPFRGQGPYVSIKPVDLQLLDRKYHDLSNNSYLMHAFYTYRHMILGEYTQDKGTFFYVGVPGEFVKKEQSSAAMFGFEGYEHSGDLGYYLYRVEL